MNLITIQDAKAYLRVDTSDDDVLIAGLLDSAGSRCADIARLSDEQWAAVDAPSYAALEDSPYTAAELAHVRNLMAAAILYALAYMYEHREEADHRKLDFTLRAMLSSLREGVV